MNYSLLKLFSSVLIFLLFGFVNASALQSDTVTVQHINSLPVIDGSGNDQSWNQEGVDWQAIDQVWMPWKGAVPSASDFSGKYKALWNKPGNLFYFLVEIVDDTFVDGYNFESNGPYGYPNYDVVEIFMDEDRSMGAHVFDNGSENARNAFSYHISVNAPADGETTDQFTIEDLDGTNWGNSWVVNYASHFPEFQMKKSGTTYVYEFSLKIYDDSYPTQQKDGSTSSDIEKSRVSLNAGKIMGVTMAYCDNDNNDGKRDHFFGSTPGKEYTADFGFSGIGNSITTENGQNIFNTCWMSSNDYGVYKLTDEVQTGTNKIDYPQWLIINPTQIVNDLKISIFSEKTGKVKVDVYDLDGSKVAVFYDIKSCPGYNASFNIHALRNGIYLTKVSFNNEMAVRKIAKF